MPPVGYKNDLCARASNQSVEDTQSPFVDDVGKLERVRRVRAIENAVDVQKNNAHHFTVVYFLITESFPLRSSRADLSSLGDSMPSCRKSSARSSSDMCDALSAFRSTLPSQMRVVALPFVR